jgi:hypothetical protein
MGAAERQMFLDLIANSSSDQFGPADLTLLVSYCEAAVMVREAGRQVKLLGPVLPDGSINRWADIYLKYSKLLTVLSTKLRIGPQGRNPTNRLSKTKTLELSAYDRMDLEGEPDDAKPS